VTAPAVDAGRKTGNSFKMFGYPRPQLERPDWTCLNGPWQFTFDDGQRWRTPADVPGWPLSIQVPYPPESAASGIHDTGFHPACWYQRTFEPPPGAGRVMLHFGAVDYQAEVWVNGQLAVVHEGGHTPFSADVTDLLREGAPQLLTVRVRDDPLDLTQPRGKQDWQLEPHSIWYPRTTGIWQTVWLERVPPTRIAELRWTPFVDGFAIDVEATIAGIDLDGVTMEVTLTCGQRCLARDTYAVVNQELTRRIVLSDPGIDDFRNELLWSPERPTLLDARIRLLRGDAVLDDVRSYTALRSVDILRDRFMLNGRPYLLRLVLDQGYWPQTLLAAPGDEALRRDVELAKAMGFNGVRKHQKIEDPRYLYWADRLGLLVWEEMPSAYRFTRTAINRVVSEWREAIARDYSHPCIIVWVPFNESWGVPELTSRRAQRDAVQALYHLTRTLDATRPVIGNDGWESSATDIIGIHDYDANPEHLRQRYASETAPEQLFDRRRPGGRILTLDGYPHRGQPIMLTEFGGIACVGQDGEAGCWGYSQVGDAASLAEKFEALMHAVIHTPMFSGFCYTQFADTFQEANGLLTADRQPKLPLEHIARVTTESRLHIRGGV
jgi:beta-galactosidase/beta-glucuronidase